MSINLHALTVAAQVRKSSRMRLPVLGRVSGPPWRSSGDGMYTALGKQWQGASNGNGSSGGGGALRKVQLVWLVLSPFLVLALWIWGHRRYKDPKIVPLEYRQDAYACRARAYSESIASVCAVHSSASETPGSRLDFGMNRLLTDEQCEASFPGLYVEIDRARKHWSAKGGVYLKDLNDAVPKSQARVQIYNNRLYVQWFSDFQQGTRTKATLASIFEAVSSAPEPIPDVEFVIQTGDNGIVEGAPWALGRRNAEEALTLIPDYGR